METLIEIVIEIVLVIIFIYPGAFIRWAFTGFRKPFKEIIEGDGSFSGYIGMATIGFFICIVKWLLRACS